MGIIKPEEIIELYKKCGLDYNSFYSVRTDINTGSMLNNLNSNYDLVNKSLVPIDYSSTAQPLNKFSNKL